MFKIIINGIIADLKGATKQELVFQNPMWDYEGMLGEYGLPFSLPFSPTNDRIFGNARSEFSATPAPTYICEQYLNDDLVGEGLIVLKDTNGAYNINFTSNLRDIFTPVSGSVRYDGFLRDILPAGPSVNPVANRNALVTWNNQVCYPFIFNDQFYAANAPGGWDNNLNSYNAGYLNTTFVPAVSVKYILTQIASYYGITIVGDFVTDTGFDKLVVLTNSAEDGSVTSNLKLAVGDETVASFINNLRNLFGLTGDVDLLNKKITLDYANKYFNAEVTADWSQFCGQMASKNQPPYTGVELDYNGEDDKAYKEATTFVKYATDFPAVGGDLNKNRLIKSNFSPLDLSAGIQPSRISMNGRTTVNGQSQKPVKVRVGFYRDMTSIAGVSRPTLSNTSSPATYSFRTDATIGSTFFRLTDFFKNEETFWQNTFQANFMINLRKINLSSFDLKSKVHINGWNYLIKRIVMDCNNPEKSLLEAYRA